jgi:hypothetical protein
MVDEINNLEKLNERIHELNSKGVYNINNHNYQEAIVYFE